MKFHAVVMAAQRAGIENELAVDAGVSHKCLIEMEGKKLIEHVLDCLDICPEVGRITVCIDNVSVLDEVASYQRLAASGKAVAVEAGTNLFTSFLEATSVEKSFPAFVTTADNVLIVPEMVSHFCKEVSQDGCEAAIALTQKEILISEYPGGQKRFHKFADGEFSNCNLYAVMNRNFSDAAKIFQTGGQFAKSPERVIKAFGLWNAIAYRLSLYTLDGAMKRLSKRVKAKVKAVRMPFPEAPIDVDNFASKALANKILKARTERAQ